MTTHTTPLTDQQLDDYEAVIRNAALLGADIDPGTAAALLAEVRRLRAGMAAFASLADRWQQMADHDDASVGYFEGPTAATLDVEIAERGHTYRRAAADVLEVLRTGRVPNGLVAAADAVDQPVSPALPADQTAVIARKDREYATCERLLREAYEEIARLRVGHPSDGSEAYAEMVRTAEPTAEETHVVADNSDDPEHVDDCPGCTPAAVETDGTPA